MATKLDRPLKRELTIGETTYTLTFSPEGLKLVEKGHRKGIEVPWTKLLASEGGHSDDSMHSGGSAAGAP